jgi:hypothetical protein
VARRMGDVRRVIRIECTSLWKKEGWRTRYVMMFGWRVWVEEDLVRAGMYEVFI